MKKKYYILVDSLGGSMFADTGYAYCVKKKEKKNKCKTFSLYLHEIKGIKYRKSKRKYFEKNLKMKYYLIAQDNTKEMNLYYHVYLEFCEKKTIEIKYLKIDESIIFTK